MNKSDLRKFYLKKRNSLSPDKIYSLSEKLCNYFFNTDIYINSQKIFTYINYKSEFVSSIIIKRALFDKKEVFLPVLSEKPHEMFFLEIKNINELSKNKFGILEPLLDYNKIAVPDSNSIIIVPALAFDKNCFRLGYGGGFYDKYLSENNDSFNIGFAFDFQITDCLPCNENDIPVDLIFYYNFGGFINELKRNWN